MPVSMQQVFQRGGKPLIDVLSHCVFSINTDVLFCYLVREFEMRPRAESAIALFDVFCSQHSPARITAAWVLPPKDLRLSNEVEVFRTQLEAIARPVEGGNESENEKGETNQGEANQVDAEEEAPDRPVVPMPPRYLFNNAVRALLDQSNAKIKRLESGYDPSLSPYENLTGGELSAAQRAFVDNVWTPWARPYLVSAGFWRIATVG